MQQNPENSKAKITRSWRIPLFAAAAAVWVLAIPTDERAWLAPATTEAALHGASNLIAEFLKDWKEVPASFVELKAYAAQKHQYLPAYDAFGQRFQYIRLTPSHFALRSFGRDGRQNTITSAPDPAVARWQPLPKSTPLYRFQKTPKVVLYPTPLILGANSPNLRWHAQIFVDRIAGNRQLLVRSHEAESLFLIAPHDLVEEFLWVPESDQIVFTATGSGRYKDGLYLWDLQKDEVSDLTQRFGEHDKANELSGERHLYLSLAGVDLKGSNVFAYIDRRKSDELDPTVFLSSSHFYQIALPSDSRPARVQRVNKDLLADQVALQRRFRLTDNIFGQRLDEAVYIDWANLPFQGDIESVVSAWQEFSVKHADSPLIPYCLWYLGSIYNDAFVVMMAAKSKDSDVIRSFGAEIAGALSTLYAGPSYLRAFGSFIYQNLLAGKPLPYTISSLEYVQAKPPTAVKRKNH